MQKFTKLEFKISIVNTYYIIQLRAGGMLMALQRSNQYISLGCSLLSEKIIALDLAI